jgi:hypothetical protein
LSWPGGGECLGEGRVLGCAGRPSRGDHIPRAQPRFVGRAAADDAAIPAAASSMASGRPSSLAQRAATAAVSKVSCRAVGSAARPVKEQAHAGSAGPSAGSGLTGHMCSPSTLSRLQLLAVEPACRRQAYVVGGRARHETERLEAGLGKQRVTRHCQTRGEDVPGPASAVCARAALRSWLPGQAFGSFGSCVLLAVL